VTLTAALELPLAPLLASVVMPFGTWMHRPCTQPATAVPSGIGAFAKQVGCSHAAPVHPSRHSHSPGLAHRPWLEQLAGERGASHCAPLQPWPWHQSPADEIEGVRVGLWHSAAGAIPAVEALALARRHARAVARAPALALRLGAVVTAPSVRARALARRRAVATTRALGRALRNAARHAAPPFEA